MNPKHLSKSVEHLTPEFIVEPSRTTLGRIDLDPASTVMANRVVRAGEIFTREDNGLRKDWFGKIFLNPPGGFHYRPVRFNGASTKSNQVLWWLKLLSEFYEDDSIEAIFVGFSIEFLQACQRSCTSRDMLPTHFPFCIPERRIAFDKVVDGNRIETRQPSHANVIVLVSDSEETRARFLDSFESVGAVVGA